jgi:hypothetical protein
MAEYQMSHPSTKVITAPQSAEARNVGCGVKAENDEN